VIKRVRDLLELEVRVLVKRQDHGHMFQRQEMQQNQNNLFHKLNAPQVVVVEVVLQELDVAKARLNHHKSNV
jgi:hypothetical protein